MGTGSFPGVKWPDRGVDLPTLSSAEVNEKVELYLYSSGSSWPVLGWTLPFIIIIIIIIIIILNLFLPVSY
jgi:hypothetical protein